MQELIDGRKAATARWNANLVTEEDVAGIDELVFGPYKMSPAAGMIAPGSTATINLEFAAEGAAMYRTPLRFEVSGRSSTNTIGKSFEVVGESCIPGIETQ